MKSPICFIVHVQYCLSLVTLSKDNCGTKCCGLQYLIMISPVLYCFRVDKLCWDPPQPPLITSQPPRPDIYFATRLLLWMLRKLWKVTLYCPHPECDKQPLTSAGIYNTVRQVVDIDSNYNLAAEYLECKNCKRKVISWSPGIVKQLDMGHQLQFPVLLTYQYACDVRVIRLLRQRGLGNSSTQLQKKLTEEHSEKYLQRSAQYLTECQYFARASRSGLTDTIHFQEPPQFMPVPKYKWLLTVYAQDIMTRIEYIKSSITSIFGRILKMDSTKKIVRKLLEAVLVPLCGPPMSAMREDKYLCLC